MGHQFSGSFSEEFLELYIPKYRVLGERHPLPVLVRPWPSIITIRTCSIERGWPTHIHLAGLVSNCTRTNPIVPVKKFVACQRSRIPVSLQYKDGSPRYKEPWNGRMHSPLHYTPLHLIWINKTRWWRDSATLKSY